MTDPDRFAEQQERTTHVLPPNQSVASIDDAKQYMLELVNDERRKAGVPPVRLGNNRAAQLHAEAALEACYSAHWDRWGLKPNHRYTLAGGTGADAENVSGHDACTRTGDGYRLLGNLSDEISDTTAGLMGSRDHRQTILNSAHTVLNAGIAHDIYNINVVQQFSSDYVTYQERPNIDEKGILRFRAATQGATLGIGKTVNIQIHYDRPPTSLTRGQLYQTYSLCGSHQAAYIVRPKKSLPQGGTVEVEDRTSITRCTDPYLVNAATKVPADPAKVEAEREIIKARALRPKETQETVHKVAATTLNRGTKYIEVEANLTEVLGHHGPGIYTVTLWGQPYHMGDQTIISTQAIFWKVTPPDHNPYEEAAEANTPH